MSARKIRCSRDLDLAKHGADLLFTPTYLYTTAFFMHPVVVRKPGVLKLGTRPLFTRQNRAFYPSLTLHPNAAECPYQAFYNALHMLLTGHGGFTMATRRKLGPRYGQLNQMTSGGSRGPAVIPSPIMLSYRYAWLRGTSSQPSILYSELKLCEPRLVLLRCTPMLDDVIVNVGQDDAVCVLTGMTNLAGMPVWGSSTFIDVDAVPLVKPSFSIYETVTEPDAAGTVEYMKKVLPTWLHDFMREAWQRVGLNVI